MKTTRYFAAIAAMFWSALVFAGSINNGIVFGNLQITGTGLFSTNVTPLPPPFIGTQVQIGSADGTIARTQLDSFGAVPSYTTRRSNGTNVSKSALLSGDSLSDYCSLGYGATDYSAVCNGKITIRASENWTDSAYGTNILFSATPNGKTASNGLFAIFGNGHLGFGISESLVPVVSACGTTPTILGNSDQSFRITVGTGGVATSCTVTFAHSWVTLPSCVASSTDIAALSVTTNTTTVVISAAAPFTASAKIHVICLGVNISG